MHLATKTQSDRSNAFPVYIIDSYLYHDAFNSLEFEICKTEDSPNTL